MALEKEAETKMAQKLCALSTTTPWSKPVLSHKCWFFLDPELVTDCPYQTGMLFRGFLKEVETTVHHPQKSALLQFSGVLLFMSYLGNF